MGMKNFWKMSLFLLAWVINSAFAIETNFEDPSEHSKTSLSAANERIIGDMIIQKINGSDFVTTDPIVNEYLQKFADKFSTRVNIADFKLHFFGVNTHELNAFAFFGANVAVHSGLILAAQNESELAAVLAHETAHISQRHLARVVAANKQMMPVTFAEILAALALGTLGSPEAGIHLATAAIAGHVQGLINFTREHEKEADRIGIKLLADTQYDPTAMATIFQRMKKHTLYHEMPPEYLMTHPIFDSRIADAQNRAAQFSHQANNDSLLFHLVRARLEVDKGGNSTKRINRLKKQFTVHATQNKTAAQYGYALTLLLNQQPKEALPILNELVAQHPNEWALELTLAEAEEASGQVQAAIDRTQRLLKTYPRNQAVILQTAEFFLKNKRPDEALALLFPYRKSKEMLMAHQMMARAYSMKRDPVLLHRSQAEWHFARGEYRESYKQLELALEYAKTKQAISQLKERRKAIRITERKQTEVSL